METPRRRRNRRNRQQAPRIRQRNIETEEETSLPYGRIIGSTVGTYFGGPMGGAIGAAVGSGAQALIKRVTGFGDYRVSGNYFVTGNDAVPEFTNDERCTVIVHKEYIADVITGSNLVGSSTAFNSVSYDINPGLNTTFPWLNSLAQNYEQYLVQGMIFEFKTNSAMAVSSTNTALGTVIMATQYNSLSTQFVNKQQMENYEYSQSCVPCESAMHPVECDPKQTACNGLFYVRVPIAKPGDLRLYDIGRFTIATQGMQAANVNIGELWVTYKICMLKPRLSTTTFPPTLHSVPAADFVSNINPFGANYVDSLITIVGNLITISPNFVGGIEIAYIIRGGDALSRIGSFAPGAASTIYPFPAISGNTGDVNSLNTYINADGSPEINSGEQTALFLCPGGPGMTIKMNNQAVTQAVTVVQSVNVWIVPWARIPDDLVPAS